MKNHLKELRMAKNKTQLQVQMATGIEQALLSKYENGVRIPPTETLMVLADYYGVSMDYIMGRTDIPEINRGDNKVEDMRETASKVIRNREE